MTNPNAPLLVLLEVTGSSTRNRFTGRLFSLLSLSAGVQVNVDASLLIVFDGKLDLPIFRITRNQSFG